MIPPPASPVTSHLAESEIPPLEVSPCCLHVLTGPDTGKTLVLDGRVLSRALIGQSPACDLRLGGAHVSRRHAVVDATGARVRVTDMGSTNGTFVNGIRVLDAYLAGGEELRIGDVVLRVDRTAETGAIPVTGAVNFGRLVGASPEMRRLYPLFERLAASEVPILIEGETGTGKEVLAEALHEEGPRASGPFVVFDCTAVAPGLLEAALFGHERGAFTGAVDSKRGVFEQATGGTLLIDEIGDLDLALQAKLLRAIERSEVRRVGGEKWIKVSSRILSATRRDLDHEVQAGRFRDDLFFRLAVARIELPPLRERRGDVALLARRFWRQLGGGTSTPSDAFLARFESYAWPGNVRELHNCVARHVALGDLAEIGSTRASLGPPSTPSGKGKSAGDDDYLDGVLTMKLPLTQARQRVVDEFERRYVARVLAEHKGNIARAAAASGIARRYFAVLKTRHGA